MRRLLAVAALMVLTACSAPTEGGADGQGGVGFQSGDGAFTIVPADQRVEAPLLEGPTVDGGTASTADLAGKIIIVNVWGSWCAPCRAEAPELVKADAELDDDVAFLGVNTRDLDVAPARAFERSFGLTYPSIYDPNGKLLLGFGQLPPKAIPSTVVIDADGKVAARVLGEVNATTLAGIVDDVRGA